LLQETAAALDGVDIALCVFDDQDKTLLWNRAFERFFPEHAGKIQVGESYRDNLRRFYAVRLGPDERADIERFVEEGVVRHRAQHRPFTFEHRGGYVQAASLALTGVGRLRVWRQVPTPRLSDVKLGQVEHLPNEFRSTQQDEHHELFEHVGDAVMLTDADNAITWVNRHFEHLLGLANKAQAVGRSFEALYQQAWLADASADPVLMAIGLATLTENMRFAGAPFELALPGRRWVRVIEQRRHDGVGFFALVDITALKRQQQDLMAAEQRALVSQARLAEKSRILETTLERMEQGVMMVNAQAVVEVCNRRAIELLGLPPAFADGQTPWAQVQPYLAGHSEAWGAGRALAALQRWELSLPQGRVMEVESVPVTGGGVLHTFSDVTERKRAEAQRLALETQLREAQRLEAIGTLAAGIAHDFNNIMAAILGNAAFADEVLPAPHPAQPYLAQISMAGQRARSLVQQILAFSRRQSEAMVDLDLRPVVEESLALLRSLAGPQVQIHAHLPDTAVVVRGNATQLQQVVMNLCTNAWQALPDQRGTIEVGVSAEVSEGIGDKPAQGPETLAATGTGGRARLWVRDDGHGMDEPTRLRIFEPFFTTKPVGQGTGWGLAVAQGVVQAHGGVIQVLSEPGQGATFVVQLPAVDGLAQQPAAPPTGVPAAVPRGQGQHVLYVDDDEVMLLMVEGLLQRLGYQVTCQADARQALALLLQAGNTVDLVVTDYNMPHCNGLELARQVRQHQPALPLLISSGYITDEMRAQAAALGVRGLMQKERTLEDLGALVHAALVPGAPSALSP
jgi:signal transduction histidine kinase/ActR/RegA family two-component response regulator